MSNHRAFFAWRLQVVLGKTRAKLMLAFAQAAARRSR